MVERVNEIKVLREINVELKSGTNKIRTKLSQEEDSEEEAIKEFNSTLDNVLEKLSQDKDSPNDFMRLLERLFFYLPVHEDVAKEAIEMANDQAEALSDQEVANECLDDEQVEEIRPSKRIIVTQEEIVKDEKPKKG
ncbi:hypothetical protein Tco_1217295 [Tanacetum coccineum]